MSRATLRRPSAILTFLLSVAFATASHAGYWEVVYDMAPGSNLQTLNPGGTYNDPITGTLTIQYDTASTVWPLTGARLVAGQLNGSINQAAGVLTVTGANTNVLSPPGSGTPGTLSGNSLNLSVVANHTLSGFLHCYDATGPGGFCSIFFGTPASNTIPQVGSGTFALPRFDFAATAGVGDFTSTAVVSMPQAGVTTTVVYRGKEISRTFVPEPGSLAMLVPGVLLLAGLRAVRRTTAR